MVTRSLLITCMFIFSLQFYLLPAAVHAEQLRLDEAVKIALTNHQRVLQAQELYSASSASATAALRDRFPKLNLKASYDRLYDSPYQNIGQHPLTVSDKNMVHYQISLEQPLFTGFSFSSRQKLAELNVDMARYDLQQTRRLLALDVHTVALQLLKAEAMQRLAHQHQQQLKKHLADIEEAYRQGMVPGNDRLKAEVALATAEQQLRSVTIQANLSRSRLNLLIGRPQQNSLEIIEPQNLQHPRQPLDQLIEIALQQRPEICTAHLAIAAADENIRLAHSNDYPHLALVASYWRDWDDWSASHNDYRNSDNASVGLQLDWNLFSSGADRSRAAASQHHQRAQQQFLFEMKDQVRLQVEEAYRQIDVAADNEKTAAKALEQARENHRLSTLQFHENLISTSDLLAAQTLLTQAESDLQTAHYGCLLAQAQLSFALGQDPLPEAEDN